MAAPKGNKFAAKNKGNTKPKTTYNPETYPDQGRKIAMMGATNIQLADFFKISEHTLCEWKHRYEDFGSALKAGKDEYDTVMIEGALRHRALGYSHRATDIRVVEGEIVETEYTKHYPPDSTAAIFWLKNRNRDRWRDKHDFSHEVEEDSVLSGILKAVSGTTLRPKPQSKRED